MKNKLYKLPDSRYPKLAFLVYGKPGVIGEVDANSVVLKLTYLANEVVFLSKEGKIFSVYYRWFENNAEEIK